MPIAEHAFAYRRPVTPALRARVSLTYPLMTSYRTNFLFPTHKTTLVDLHYLRLSILVYTTYRFSMLDYQQELQASLRKLNQSTVVVSLTCNALAQWFIQATVHDTAQRQKNREVREKLFGSVPPPASTYALPDDMKSIRCTITRTADVHINTDCAQVTEEQFYI